MCPLGRPDAVMAGCGPWLKFIHHSFQESDLSFRGRKRLPIISRNINIQR